uniref:NADH-ubiquinone oxidoreductase chain 2 n=1 Tax=Flustrellidra hispida TaxID=97271 RepID=Q15K45_9BILA|nr:NADH dehydrogenase subunit 2 [Flustrellidra hispida]AAZ76753.1 NADH dehydrogenase subunit 2 [Flustrellidra hispida]
MRYTSVMLTSIMLVGLLCVMSSDSHLIMWAGMELIMLGFIPFIVKHTHASVYYFLIQAVGGMSFLAGWATHTLLTISMLIKLGLFPFFAWVPPVISTMSWGAIFTLMTYMKIAPFYLTLHMWVPDYLMALGIASAAFLGVTAMSWKNLLAYSSIGHTSWLVLSMYDVTLFIFLWVFYFVCMTPFARHQKNLVSLYMLSGLPPSPLFLGKCLIVIHAWTMYGMLPGFLLTFVAVSSYMYMRFFVYYLCVVSGL